MERVVRFSAPREVELVEVEERRPGAGEVRVRTLLSGISAGTELTAYRGSNPYLAKRWDGERRLFVDGEPTFAYQAAPLVQVRVARRVLAAQGWRAWPVCSRKIGVR